MWQIHATRGSLQGYRRILASLIVAAACCCARSAAAQDPWEYTPYKIQIWLALEAVPELPDGMRRDLQRAIVEQSEAAFAATWEVHVERAPARFAAELLYRLDQFPVDDFVASAKLGKLAQPKKPEGKSEATDDPPPPVDPLVAQMRAVFKCDKLLVASVRAADSGWRVQARELDIRSRRWTAVVERDAADPESLPRIVVAALHQSFLPIARIDYAKEKAVMLRLRAGGLAVRPEEPVIVGEQALLRPWVRHNDRYGEPRPPMGVQAIPFSYLVVQKREASRLECEVHTGVKFPITGRNSARTERFALAVRPMQPTTLVRLRTNEKPPQPLSGYDIFAKDPRSEKVELIGRTDWRGAMELPTSADFPLRVVYVKNGGSLLARLPTVPGVDPEMFVDLTPDDKRLQAEGFVSGVQAVLTDLVAQRELYAKRIRTRLTEGKLGDAEKLLEEFKALQTRDDVQKLIDQQQPRITSPHKKVQAKIDKHFEDTRKLLYKFVDPGLAGKLETEVKQTREGKGPYAAVSSAMDRALAAPAPVAAAPAAGTPAAPAAGAPAGSPPLPPPMPMPMGATP